MMNTLLQLPASPGIQSLSRLGIDITKNWGGYGITNLGDTSLVGTFTVGVDDTGHDVKFYGATAGRYMLWDESADALILDTAGLYLTTGGVRLATIEHAWGVGGVSLGYDTGSSYLSVCIGPGAGRGVSAVNNVFIGNQTGGYLGIGCSGLNNVGLGAATLSWVTTGASNLAMGESAGKFITTGSYNLLGGARVGENLTTGSYNVIMGYRVDASAADVDYELNIGGIIKGDMTAGSERVDFPYDVSLLGDDIYLTMGDDPAVDYTMRFDSINGRFDENAVGTKFGGDVEIYSDSKKLLLGANNDVSMGYDGTDAFIDTDEQADTPTDLVIKCGTAKTLELQNVVYEDLQVSINNLAKGATAPTDRFYNHGVAAGIEFPVLGFAKNEYVWFDVQTHHAMKLNTVLENHIHFILPDTTTIGHKFVFQLDVIVAGINGTWAVPTGSPFTATHTVVADDNSKHRLLDICDIPSSNTTISSVYKCRLTRIDGEVTEYASEVYLEFNDCHYQKDTMGSRNETAK